MTRIWAKGSQSHSGWLAVARSRDVTGLGKDTTAGVHRARREMAQMREMQEQMVDESYEHRQMAEERSEMLRATQSSDDLRQVEIRDKKAGEHRCQSDRTCDVLHPGQSMASGGRSRG